MRKFFSATISFSLIAAMLFVGMILPVGASSNREAPLITADPLADNTDVYAFRSTEAGRENYVTLIANFIPLEIPGAGPHYYRFDDTVLYEIKIDNTGDGVEDISYQFNFSNQIRNGDTVLGMAAPTEALSGKGGIDPLITDLNDPDYNEVQTYSVTRVDKTTGKNGKILAPIVQVPPANIGSRTTPDYENIAQRAIRELPGGGKVFAGQRDDSFFIPVNEIFDTLNLTSIKETGGKDALAGLNVHSIAIEVPIRDLTISGTVPATPTSAGAVIGVWSTASRQTARVRDAQTKGAKNGKWVQISRLGNPLVNEVIIPLKLKDAFNGLAPKDDAIAAPFVLDPQLAKLLKAVFKIDIPAAPRNDLVAIFATGIKAGSVPGAPDFNTFLSDGKPHEMMRLNVAIPPSANPNRLGLLGGDPAGHPNGRRVFDDVTDIALRAVAGGTPFTPATNKAPNNVLGDGVSQNDLPFLTRFPYLASPHSGNPKK
ncbi:MAG: DUF4331 domain-containing protein [Pyrinomonadaceae bacterium]